VSIHDLRARIARLPEQPGVYLYSNRAGETIYVGKARVLRDRVRSYLAASGTNPKTDALLDEVAGIDVVVTDSVMEALALENNLIKQRTPRYNVLLRDAKSYPYLRLTMGEAYPRIHVVRRVERDGHHYTGPFLPASLGRRTMDLTHRLFGIRSCREALDGQRDRPCLEYDIHRCIAPCVASICSAERYAAAARSAQLFLEGRGDELLEALQAQMSDAAAQERFEQAAQLRDAIRTVETLRDRKQKMATPGLRDRDVFGVKLGADGVAVHVFQVRRGRVIDRVDLSSDLGPGGSDAEVVEAALQQFYQEQAPPPEVHVAVQPPDPEWIEQWLSARAGRRVRLVVPRRGAQRELVDLATRNAALAYESRVNRSGLAQYDALETLRTLLNLPRLPRRIDGFDISTIQGSETVASMVVCENGRMRRSEYRKFRITGAGRQGPAGGGPDDFAAMQEVVSRRYRRVAEDEGPWPDLIVIDGGQGQLSAAYQALADLDLAHLVAIGLAKKEELIFTRDGDEPLALPRESPALRLLQRIRDEAHRFAVTFHRRARTTRDLRSALDAVPGVGPKRRTALLKRFGSLAGVRRATREELEAVAGSRAAEAIRQWFDAERGGGKAEAD
jgi:excinuclease ABC subunit C